MARRPRKRYRSTTNRTHTHAVAENVVNRELEVPEMNRVGSSMSPALPPLKGGCICA